MAEDTTTTTIAEPETTEAAAPVAAPAKKRKLKRTVTHGQVHIQATFNNTIVSITDQAGGVLTTASAGGCGFRGSKKGTAYAAQVAAEKAAEVAKGQYGLASVDAFVSGVGLGRDAAIRTMQNFDIRVDSIRDVTGVPHGGVRPKRQRRA